MHLTYLCYEKSVKNCKGNYHAYFIIHICFQLPMTEAHTFKLTTAENELGVVIACSEQGKRSQYVFVSVLIINFT